MNPRTRVTRFGVAASRTPIATNAPYPTRITGFRPTRSDRIPAGNAWDAYTMLNRTYRRIATTFSWPTSVTRRRRNATEKSANENTLAIPMNRTRDLGTLRRLARKRGWRTAARGGSRTRATHTRDTAAGSAAIRMISRNAETSD